MFSAPVGHKRHALNRDLGFRRPRRACFACYDSGVIANGDGLVNRILGDYDRTCNGQRIPGCDLPLICHCAAAHNPASRGLRGPDGPIAQGLASELTRDQVASLHEQRLASWQETERLMRDALMARAAGDPQATPWFIAEVRHSVRAQADRQAAAEQTDPTEDGPRRLQPLGGILAETLSSPEGPLQQIEPQVDPPAAPQPAA
ncbi:MULTISPECIES: hypothetical protein [unclassified Synechococcus]|uniref:hypothetical protein n=1 Tax=unclassified Synechococcus TaxID=2626047 RepID=UPI001C2436BC|nr:MULTISPECIES: hypothetical protein [unclassified Synechococcus]